MQDHTKASWNPKLNDCEPQRQWRSIAKPRYFEKLLLYCYIENIILNINLFSMLVIKSPILPQLMSLWRPCFIIISGDSFICLNLRVRGSRPNMIYKKKCRNLCWRPSTLLKRYSNLRVSLCILQSFKNIFANLSCQGLAVSGD